MNEELRYLLAFLIIVVLTSSGLSIIYGSKETNESRDYAYTASGVYHVSEGRNVDVFTQRGGKGQSVSSPPFTPEEDVMIYANVTYNGYPCSYYHVAFRIVDPHENTAILVGTTNTSGIATTSFHLPEFIGAWRIVASVNIADVVVNDTLEFRVRWNVADINDDLKVDTKDLAIAALAYGSFPGHPNWNPIADITGSEHLVPDGRVDIRDLALMASNYGETYP